MLIDADPQPLFCTRCWIARNDIQPMSKKVGHPAGPNDTGCYHRNAFDCLLFQNDSF